MDEDHMTDYQIMNRGEPKRMGYQKVRQDD